MNPQKVKDQSLARISVDIAIDPRSLLELSLMSAKNIDLSLDVQILGKSYILLVEGLELKSISELEKGLYNSEALLNYKILRKSSEKMFCDGEVNIDSTAMLSLQDSFVIETNLKDLNLRNLSGPYLRLFGRKLKIKSIAKLVFGLFKKRIIRLLNDHISSIDLKPKLSEIIKTHIGSRELAEELWLDFSPTIVEAYGFNKLLHEGRASICVYGIAHLSGQSEQPTNHEQLNLCYKIGLEEKLEELTSVPIKTSISFETLALYLNKKLKELPIEKYGQRIWVLIDQIVILNETGLIQIYGNIEGSQSGFIELTGKLTLDKSNQVLAFDLVEMNLRLESNLFQSGASLFKKYIQRQIAELLVLDIKPIINRELHKFNNGDGQSTMIEGSKFIIKTTLRKVIFSDLRVEVNGLQVMCLIEGKLSLVDSLI